jgi:hypothetical protein
MIFEGSPMPLPRATYDVLRALRGSTKDLLICAGAFEKLDRSERSIVPAGGAPGRQHIAPRKHVDD